MDISNGSEPRRKQVRDTPDTSLTPPVTYSQLSTTSSLQKSNAPQTLRTTTIKREDIHDTQSQRYTYDDKEYSESENGSNYVSKQRVDEAYDSNESNNSINSKGNPDSYSQSNKDSISSEDSIRNKVLATIQETLNKSTGLQAQPSSSDTSPTYESSSSSDGPKTIDKSPMDEPSTIYTEPISVIINYIERNCDKVENYLLGVGDHSFIGVFGAIMKSFYETGFVSLKQLSMYRAKAPEFFTKLSHFLMQMGLGYVSRMNSQNDITPLNSYSAAYIVSCAMECMSESQRKQYIYQLRRDSSNRLRQRRGFNTKRVELGRLSQVSPHGISHYSFFQHNFQEKVINLRG